MRILYVIDWAGISGGAERLVMDTIEMLPGEKHMAYFYRQEEFDESHYPAVRFWNLGVAPSFTRLPGMVRALKKIIADNNITVVFSHLYWSNVTARLATPPGVKLLTCIANIESMASLKHAHLRMLERLLHRRRETTICMSDAVRDDYRKIVPEAKNMVTIYNCVSDKYFLSRPGMRKWPAGKINIIAIGYVKPQKNYGYLLEVFKLLKQSGYNEIRLDVYGGGALLETYRQLSVDAGVAIDFKGECFQLEALIHQYDAYILASHFEGFGTATLEAMAQNIPVLVSDIPVNHEVTGGNAIFFDLQSPADCAAKLSALAEGKIAVDEMVARAYQHACQVGTTDKYVEALIPLLA